MLNEIARAGRVKATFEDLGNLQLKNIERPIQAFSVHWDSSDWQAPDEQVLRPVGQTPAAVPLDRPELSG